MKLETSTTIPATEVKAIEAKLRKAAVDSKNDKYFGPNEKIEVVNGPNFPSLGELAKKSSGGAAPMAGSACDIAYAAAKIACQGDSSCEAIAALAYQICKASGG